MQREEQKLPVRELGGYYACQIVAASASATAEVNSNPWLGKNEKIGGSSLGCIPGGVEAPGRARLSFGAMQGIGADRCALWHDVTYRARTVTTRGSFAFVLMYQSLLQRDY